MTVNVIAAVAGNGAIGRDNALLWHLRADMKYFRETTMGSPVIMGRRTFESLGRPLPGRLNIVVSRSAGRDGESLRAAHSLLEAVTIAAASGAENCFVIGGGQIYEQAMAFADKLLITKVFCEPKDADTFFPAIDTEKWELLSCSGRMVEEGMEYRFETYGKK